MRTAAERDDMVKRVKAALKKWPTFADLPETKKTKPVMIHVEGDNRNEGDYHIAMYEVCATSTPIGRNGNAIVGE